MGKEKSSGNYLATINFRQRIKNCPIGNAVASIARRDMLVAFLDDLQCLSETGCFVGHWNPDINDMVKDDPNNQAAVEITLDNTHDCIGPAYANFELHVRLVVEREWWNDILCLSHRGEDPDRMTPALDHQIKAELKEAIETWNTDPAHIDTHQIHIDILHIHLDTGGLNDDDWNAAHAEMEKGVKRIAKGKARAGATLSQDRPVEMVKATFRFKVFRTYHHKGVAHVEMLVPADLDLKGEIPAAIMAAAEVRALAQIDDVAMHVGSLCEEIPDSAEFEDARITINERTIV